MQRSTRLQNLWRHQGNMVETPSGRTILPLSHCEHLHSKANLAIYVVGYCETAMLTKGTVSADMHSSSL